MVNHFPYQDLIIYEIGAGNGSFMIDTLTFLRQEHPEVYAKTKFKIIEISGMLAKGQKARAVQHGFGGKVEVINEDFFRWKGGSSEPCFVVALEVFVSCLVSVSSNQIPTSKNSRWKQKSGLVDRRRL